MVGPGATHALDAIHEELRWGQSPAVLAIPELAATASQEVLYHELWVFSHEVEPGKGPSVDGPVGQCMRAAGPHTVGVAELVGVVSKPSEHQLRWLPRQLPGSGRSFVAARGVRVPVVRMVGQGLPPAAEDLDQRPKTDAEPAGQLGVDRCRPPAAIAVEAITQAAPLPELRPQSVPRRGVPPWRVGARLRASPYWTRASSRCG